MRSRICSLLLYLSLVIIVAGCSDTPNPPTSETPSLPTRALELASPTEIVALNTEPPPTPLTPRSSTPRLGAIVIATPLPPTQTSPPAPTHVPVTDTPPPSPAAEDTAIPTTLYSAVVNDDDVNFRTGPGYQYQSLGKYSRGTPLNVYAKDNTGA